MSTDSHRLGIGRNPRGKAHFLNLVAPQVADCVRAWRAECPELWPKDQREIDPAALRQALGQAQRLRLDPYLVAYVVMGAEWLFRARPLTLQDLEDDLDQLERRLARSTIAGTRPRLASPVTGGIARVVAGGCGGGLRRVVWRGCTTTWPSGSGRLPSPAGALWWPRKSATRRGRPLTSREVVRSRGRSPP